MDGWQIFGEVAREANFSRVTTNLLKELETPALCKLQGCDAISGSDALNHFLANALGHLLHVSSTFENLLSNSIPRQT